MNRFFGIFILTVMLAGCATGQCQKTSDCASCASQYVPPTVSAPAAETPAPEAATPAAPVVSSEEKIPAAVMK